MRVPTSLRSDRRLILPESHRNAWEGYVLQTPDIRRMGIKAPQYRVSRCSFKTRAYCVIRARRKPHLDRPEMSR